jgi:hypothetical protein
MSVGIFLGTKISIISEDCIFDRKNIWLMDAEYLHFGGSRKEMIHGLDLPEVPARKRRATLSIVVVDQLLILRLLVVLRLSFD